MGQPLKEPDIGTLEKYAIQSKWLFAMCIECVVVFLSEIFFSVLWVCFLASTRLLVDANLMCTSIALQSLDCISNENNI